MKTISFEIEQHILLAILEAKDRKVKKLLLAETREKDYGTEEGRLIRRRMSRLTAGKRKSSTLGDASVFREDGALKGSAKEMLSPIRKETLRRARNCTLTRAEALCAKLKHYAQNRILMQGAKDLYGVLTGKEKEETRARALTTMIATVNALGREGVGAGAAKVQERDNVYYAVGRKGDWEAVSSFSLRPKAWVQSEDASGSALECVLVSSEGKQYKTTLPHKAFQCARDFKKYLPDRLACRWTGSDAHVEGVLALLAQEDPPRVRGTAVLGRGVCGGEECYVGREGLIYADKRVRHDKAPLRYTDQGVQYPIRWPRPAKRSDAREIIKLITKLHPKEWPLLGWFCAAPFRPRLLKTWGHAPSAILWGPPGSGKTTLALTLARCTSGVEHEHSVSETQFVLIRLFAATNAFPLILDEYKPTNLDPHVTKRINHMANSAYTGTLVKRGHGDQSLSNYPLRAPAILIGERCPTDRAWNDRSIIIGTSGNDLTEKYKRRMAKLARFDLCRLAPLYLAHCLTYTPDLDGARATVARCAPELDPRTADALATVLIGVQSWRAFAASLGADIKVPSDKQLVAQSKPNESEQQRQSVLDEFVITLSDLIVGDKISEAAWELVDTDTLALHLPSCIDRYCERQKMLTNVIEDPKALARVLRREIREMAASGYGYVKATHKQTRISGLGKKCLWLDQTEAQRLDGYAVVTPREKDPDQEKAKW